MTVVNLVSRSQWGARSATAISTLIPAQVDALVFHYSGSDADEQADHRNCAARVRGIQRYHMETKRWTDIAYSYIVCKHGYVFEGRGIERMTAATYGHNDHTLAVCFLGDDSVNRDDVTAAGRRALLDITRYIRARRLNCRKLGGHRDYVNTSCPGNEIYSYIHGSVFLRLLDFDNAKRLAALRKWILQQRAHGRTWAWIKKSPNWREFLRRGGK